MGKRVLALAVAALPCLVLAQSAIDGSWQTDPPSPSGGVTFTTANGVLSMHATSGSRYAAKIGGAKAPATGDPAVDAVAVVMKGKDTMEETNWRAGKAWLVNTMTVAPDGKTATVHWVNLLNKSQGSYKLVKQ